MISSVNKSDIKKKRLYELDYMRFIACFAVMIVHITATGVTDYIQGSFPHIFILLINRSFKYTTPIFIFLSGVTSFYAYNNKKLKYGEFLKKRLVRVLLPYLFWCVLYYTIYMRIGLYSWNFSFFIKNIVQGTMSYHLYFVIIITQLYILGPVFYSLVKNSKNREATLAIAAVITALCVEFVVFHLSDRIFLKYMFFYMLGIYITVDYEKYISFVNKNKIKIVISYIIISIIYTAVSYYNMKIYSYVWFIFSTLSIFFVYVVGLVLDEKLKSIYSFIKLFGQGSYYIYLMHPLLLTIMIRLTTNYGILSVTKRIIIYFVTVVPITVITCLIYAAVKNRIKGILKKKKNAAALSN